MWKTLENLQVFFIICCAVVQFFLMFLTVFNFFHFYIKYFSDPAMWGTGNHLLLLFLYSISYSNHLSYYLLFLNFLCSLQSLMSHTPVWVKISASPHMHVSTVIEAFFLIDQIEEHEEDRHEARQVWTKNLYLWRTYVLKENSNFYIKKRQFLKMI